MLKGVVGKEKELTRSFAPLSLLQNAPNVNINAATRYSYINKEALSHSTHALTCTLQHFCDRSRRRLGGFACFCIRSQPARSAFPNRLGERGKSRRNLLEKLLVGLSTTTPARPPARRLHKEHIIFITLSQRKLILRTCLQVHLLFNFISLARQASAAIIS